MLPSTLVRRARAAVSRERRRHFLRIRYFRRSARSLPHPTAKAGKLRLSNLLPWQALDGEEMAFYLPRPLLVQGEALPCGASYTESCEKATAYKRQKKLRYLRASRLQAYMTARSSGNAFPDEEVQLGSASLRQRVNCREAMKLPYFVGQFDFAPGAGLYLVAYLAD